MSIGLVPIGVLPIGVGTEADAAVTRPCSVAVSLSSWSVSLTATICSTGSAVDTITIGTEVILKGTFSDTAGDAATPATAPQCTVTNPSGTSTTYTTGTSPAVTNTATGVYTLDLTPGAKGYWRYYWFVPTSDAAPVADEATFYVLSALGYSG